MMPDERDEARENASLPAADGRAADGGMPGPEARRAPAGGSGGAGSGDGADGAGPAPHPAPEASAQDGARSAAETAASASAEGPASQQTANGRAPAAAAASPAGDGRGGDATDVRPSGAADAASSSSRAPAEGPDTDPSPAPAPGASPAAPEADSPAAPGALASADADADPWLASGAWSASGPGGGAPSAPEAVAPPAALGAGADASPASVASAAGATDAASSSPTAASAAASAESFPHAGGDAVTPPAATVADDVPSPWAEPWPATGADAFPLPETGASPADDLGAGPAPAPEAGTPPVEDGAPPWAEAAPATGADAVPLPETDAAAAAPATPPETARQPSASAALAAEEPGIHPTEVLPPEPGSGSGGSSGGGQPPGGGGGPRGGRQPEPDDKPMSVVEHLDELRRRLMWMIGALLVGVAVGFYLVKPMVHYLELPLHGLRLYITAPLDPLFAFVKISVAFGLVVASPVILYQLTAYVMPALTHLERRLLFSYLPAATGLFIAGLAFGFYVFIPLVIDAMLRFSGTTLTPILTIGNYISFLLSFTLPFGVVFEMPVIVVTLVRLGLLSPETLASGRRWALMVTVVIAAIFAPPDPITPLVMAMPIYGLYEVSIWVARLAARRRRAE